MTAKLPKMSDANFDLLMKKFKEAPRPNEFHWTYTGMRQIDYMFPGETKVRVTLRVNVMGLWGSPIHIAVIDNKDEIGYCNGKKLIVVRDDFTWIQRVRLWKFFTAERDIIDASTKRVELQKWRATVVSGDELVDGLSAGSITLDTRDARWENF